MNSVQTRITDELKTLCSLDGYTLTSTYANPDTPLTLTCPLHGTSRRTCKQLRQHRFCLGCWRIRKSQFKSDCEFRVYRYFVFQGLKPTCQVPVPDTRLTIDFELNGVYIEVDGSQHHTPTRKWRLTKADFEDQKRRDRLKTEWVVGQQKRLFRWCDDAIKTFPDIEAQLSLALQCPGAVYYSHPERYQHLV